ncbi:Response regulator containing a CheY-like receiver domain and a GGDEF domain [Candidatus Terasakiella magnetica]|uniref:diguanylate cyclase n=1 Tax=Candidatus Terasakiella magnetica TaxID=1867952 RepID=A0A1C3RE72_9PROT|nr:sensor domain-containing diguanylate cyclase [Candidatus Terasakiella magnetica]SCA55532.1 Response regulator containing a CheY-like receiver domain and a GGDEF domain [Candidatus Terasakiella magnetica]
MSTRHSEHQFAIRLMEHLVVPTFVLDPQGNVIIWNKACERLTKVKAEEVLGTKDHWKAFYEESRVCLADLVLNSKTEQLEELYLSHSPKQDIYDGVRAENWCVMPRASKRLYLAINCGPIFDDDGHIIGVVETLRDMTEQKQAEQALESLAHKDGLTGLANRRSFDMCLETNLLHARREQEHLALLLCDVDHFKLYNDTYGHQKGDDCLKEVAQAVGKQIFRATDMAARYGGEEFAMIIPTSDEEGAQRVAKRVQEAVYELNLEHNSSLTDDRVTMSVGAVSLIPGEDVSPSVLIEMADQALYQAKEAGRNRICMFQQA